MTDRITTEEAERIAQPIAEAFGAVELANIALEAQAAEIERLREALRVAARQMHCATTLRHPNDNECHCPGCEAARAALGEEDG